MGNAQDSEEASQENNHHCTDIKMLPGFDNNTYPFMLTRTENYINLVDFKNKRSYQVLETKKPAFDNEFMSIVMSNTGKVSVVFAQAVKNEINDQVF